MSTPSSPPPGAATGRSGSQGYPSSDRSETDGSGELRAELARVLDPVAFDPRAVPQNVGQYWDRWSRRQVAEEHAERALAAGWRRVTDDPTEVERIAEGVRTLEVAEWKRSRHGTRHAPWSELGPDVRGWYLRQARFALAVLRGGAQ